MMKYFQKPFFRKLFLSYTAVLMACALVFSSILLQQIIQRNHSLQEQQCRSDARLVAQVVDDKFTEIESISAQLSSARWFQKVRSQSEERYFSSVGLPGDLMDDPDVREALAASYNSMVVLPGENGDFYVFKQLNYAAHPDAVLFCLINASWFQQFLSQRFADSLGSMEILSGGGAVFSMTQEGKAPDQWQHFSLDSSLYQWDYSIQIVPPQTAFAAQTLLLVSLFLLVLLVGEALALARASYAPLSQLMQRLNLLDHPNNEQEFQAMEHVFQELGRQNQDLQQVSTQYYNTMRTHLISSLLAGGLSRGQAGTAASRVRAGLLRGHGISGGRDGVCGHPQPRAEGGGLYAAEHILPRAAYPGPVDGVCRAAAGGHLLL